MSRSLLIYNPEARGGRAERRLASALGILRDAGVEVESRATAVPGHATELAREASANGHYSTVFALGGDGTVRETAAGLLGSETALGVLPAGTVNVVALALGLPLDAAKAARALVGARRRDLDVGCCNDHPFLMSASAGLDARVMARIRPALKRRLGQVAVLVQGLYEWARYDYPKIELLADGREMSGTLAVVCNLPYYAGRFLMAPDVSLDDRRLQLVLFQGGRAASLGFARDLALGRHLRRSDVLTMPIQRVELLAPPGLDVQLDGDSHPDLPPVTITLSKKRLKVLMP